jgi:hypothetical protein
MYICRLRSIWASSSAPSWRLAGGELGQIILAAALLGDDLVEQAKIAGGA